jgi:lysophospholipase L1-like esterase
MINGATVPSGKDNTYSSSDVNRPDMDRRSDWNEENIDDPSYIQNKPDVDFNAIIEASARIGTQLPEMEALLEDMEHTDVGELTGKVTDLKSDLSFATNVIRLSKTGSGYITTGGISVGGTVNVGSVVADATYEYYLIPCTEGDEFTIKQIKAGSSPRAWCFIDEDNKLISVASGTNAVQTNISLIAPADAAYLICDNYKHDTEGIIYAGTALGAVVNGIDAKLSDYFVATNLLYGKTQQSGYKGISGNVVANSDYVFYEFPVKKNVLYYIEPRGRFVYIENGAGTKIYGDSANTITSFTAPDDGTAYVTFYSNQSHYKVYPSTETRSITEINKVLLNPNSVDVDLLNSGISDGNILYQKKWAVCGDSFTAGATNNVIADGKYAGQKIVYPYLIGNRNNMDIVNFFEHGRTLAYPSDGTFANSLTNPSANWYYQNIPADADYITIYLGINDGNHYAGSSQDEEDTTGYIGLGAIDDNTTATYYGAWNVVLSWLMANRPFAHIGIIISNGCLNADWMNAQIAIANKYGLPYLNLNGDERCPAMIRSQNPNIPASVKAIIKNKQAVDPDSNTHPNDDAHIFESTFIENFLRSI